MEDNLILVGTDRSNLKQCTEITSREYIQTVTCASTEPVRYVTIQHKSLTVLGICEVIVNGYLNTGKHHCDIIMHKITLKPFVQSIAFVFF